MKRCKKLRSESELPDCVMSYIFSKLALKDLVKTSVLSKRWIHEWGLRMDLNFDLHTMFDYNTIHDLPKSLPLFQRFHFLSEFAKSLDQFMFHYQGDMIHSIRINFPLGNEQRDLIDRLISKGIAKGAKRIELLFKSETNDTTDYILPILPNDITDSILPYEFSLILLSNNDSLTYLHLQNCLLVEPMDFSGLKNLRTLVLHLVDLKQKLLQSLCSHCSHLVDLTLDDCQFTSSLIINSPTLLHLNIVNCGVRFKRYITIIASNLSSLEYSCNEDFEVHLMNIQAPMLSKFIFRGDEFSNPVGFSGLKNVTTMRLGGLMENLSTHILPHLFSECLQLEDVTFYECMFTSSPIKITSPKLRHLNIIGCGWASKSPYEIAIDALNLSSFECCVYTGMVFVKAPRLLKVFWNAAVRERKTPHPFGPIERLPHIENLALTIGSGQVSRSKPMFAS